MLLYKKHTLNFVRVFVFKPITLSALPFLIYDSCLSLYEPYDLE